jgi:tRNA:m4X modification enzyme
MQQPRGDKPPLLVPPPQEQQQGQQQQGWRRQEQEQEQQQLLLPKAGAPAARKYSRLVDPAAREAVRLEHQARGRCQVFLEGKGRFCNQVAASAGASHCCTHAQAALGADARRVPCPLDPAHDVKEDRLEAHLRVCNRARQRVELEGRPYYSPGLNAPATLAAAPEPEPEWAAVQAQVLSALDGWLLRVGAEARPELVEVLSMAELEARRRAALLGKRTRHAAQEAAIVQQATECAGVGAGELPSGTCVVEMGAGRGGLSMAFCSAMSPHCVGFFVCVDRQATRNHAAAAIERSGDGKRVAANVRIDIRDLDLWRVPLVEHYLAQAQAEPQAHHKPPPLLMASKHLCGAATCLTLRCAVNGSHKPDAVAIALCCHQLCSFETYVNRDMFTETLGVGKAQFDAVTKMSSWAITQFEQPSGPGHKAAARDKEGGREAECSVKRTSKRMRSGDADADADAESDAGAGGQSEDEDDELDQHHVPVVEAPKGLSPAQRTLIGLKCKLLLNHGRVLFLQQHGFQARLARYTSKETTLENVMLLASPAAARQTRRGSSS